MYGDADPINFSWLETRHVCISFFRTAAVIVVYHSLVGRIKRMSGWVINVLTRRILNHLFYYFSLSYSLHISPCYQYTCSFRLPRCLRSIELRACCLARSFLETKSFLYDSFVTIQVDRQNTSAYTTVSETCLPTRKKKAWSADAGNMIGCVADLLIHDDLTR